MLLEAKDNQEIQRNLHDDEIVPQESKMLVSGYSFNLATTLSTLSNTALMGDFIKQYTRVT